MKQKTNFLSKNKILLLLIPVLIAVYFIYTKSDNKPVEQKMTAFDSFEFKKEGELTFLTSNEKFITQIDIEIADDDESRTTGLMFRNKLEPQQGMLFVFDIERVQSFWMKNTVLPLDMIFVNKENVIVKIHKNTTPFSEQSYASLTPALYVVEVNAGFTDKFSIHEGDKIVWRKV